MWMLNWPTAWKPEPIVPKLQVAVWPLGLQGLPALKLSPEASVIVKIVFVDESGPALSTVALTTMSLPGACEPTGPLRLSLRSADGAGGATAVNDCGSVELCPSGLITTTSSVPAGIEGVTALSTEPPTTFTVGEATPPNVTDAPGWKLLPMTVTVVPPAVGPVDGESREVVGAATAGVEAGVVGVVAPPEPLVGGVESGGGGGVVPLDVSVEPPAGGVESGGGVVVLPPVASVEPPAGGVGSAGADTSYSCIVVVARALLGASSVGAESGVAAAAGTAAGAGSAPCTNVGVAPIVSVTTGGPAGACSCFAGRTDCGAN